MSDFRFDSAFVLEADEPGPEHAELALLLNELYVAESRSIFRYLENWQPYTDARTIGLRRLARRIAKASFDHADRLAHLIEDTLGGVTEPGAYEKTAADANYTSWANLLPRLLHEKRRMIVRYNAVMTQMAGLPGADLVRDELLRLSSENQEHLAGLETWERTLGA